MMLLGQYFNGMYEVELKLEIDEYVDIEDRLREIGAKLYKVVNQEDYYYQHPCRDFKESDEALRLRIEDSTIRLGYKGPRLSKSMKIREEFEVNLDNQEEIKEVLERLGFKLVAVIKKIRRIYKYERFIISLDKVDELGRFIEIEGKTLSRNSVKKVEEDIQSLIRFLGLDPGKSILKSYLELYLEERGY